MTTRTVNDDNDCDCIDFVGNSDAIILVGLVIGGAFDFLSGGFGSGCCDVIMLSVMAVSLWFWWQC